MLRVPGAEYEDQFLVLIDVMEKMKGKVWDRKEAPQIQTKLVLALANLEILLPVYFFKQTRHMLVCQFVKTLNRFGSFWAISMLWLEFYHTLGTLSRSLSLDLYL